jgi:BNR repeat-containing family member
MTTALLRVPRRTPLPSPTAWFQALGPPEAFVGSDNVNSSVYYNGKTYFGYIDGDGRIRVSSYDHASRAVATSPAIVSGLAIDRHSTPSVLVRQSDHKLLVAIAPHATAHMYVALSTNAEDVSSFGAATDINTTLGGTAYTYPNLRQLSGESGKIYLFFRDFQSGTTNTLCYSTSTDGGSTWTAQTSLYKNAGKQSYWAIGSDSASRIDLIVSDGAASAGDTASLYHFYYSGGSYFKSDGTVISAGLPLAPSNLTKIFDGATNGSVRLPYSVAVGSPLQAAWAAYDTAGSAHNQKYWYGVYTGGSWVVNEIVDSGTPPDINTLLEGGLALDRITQGRVYVSRFLSGLWQVLLYNTSDNGATWTSTQLTTDAAQPNYRPITPQNAAAAVRALWNFGPLGTGDLYFGSQTRGYPNPIGPF